MNLRDRAAGAPHFRLTYIAAAALLACSQTALAQVSGAGGGTGGGPSSSEDMLDPLASSGQCVGSYCGGGAGGASQINGFGQAGGGGTDGLMPGVGGGNPGATQILPIGTLLIPSTGGNGQRGGDGSGVPSGYGSGGGGGAGGTALTALLGSAMPYTTGGNLLGGNGGNGGNGFALPGQVRGGGGGGAGGAGLRILAPNQTVINSHAITGGRGGDGGLGQRDPALADYADGHAGQGGHGVAMYSGGQITNTATGRIQGGDGGSSTYADGSAGSGIVGGNGLWIINEGVIAAGQGGINARFQPKAIEFVSGGMSNVLEIRPGSSILGNVDGNGALLRLGGDTNDTFNVAELGFGSNYKYSGFWQYEKTGNSVWRLTGSANNPQQWTIYGGTLIGDSKSLTGNIVNNATLELNQTTDGTLLSTISGTGTVVKTGAGTLTTNVTHSYTGPTTVREGTLQVNGKLTSLVTVQNGATLSGSGTVGTVLVFNGGTLRPTSSNSVMRITGDLMFSPGSTLMIATRPEGGAGALKVGGTATLDGNFALNAVAGQYTTGTKYTVLTASDVQGKFATARSNLAYVQPKLSYTGDGEVIMTLERPTSDGPDMIVRPGAKPGTPTESPAPGPVARFEDAVNTPNQRATARGVESLPASSPVYQYVVGLPNGAPTAVMQALSGEVHASGGGVAYSSSNTGRNLTLQHLRSNLGAGLRAGSPTAAAGASDAPPSAATLPQSNAQPAWLEVVGNWQTFKGDSNTSSVRQHMGGLFLGADHEVGAGWRVGGAVGITDSKIKADDVSSTSDVSGYSATLYGGKAIDAGSGKLNVMAGVSYTWSDIETKRNLAGAGLDQTLKANYGASTVQLFGETGYAFQAGRGLTLEPFAGLAWTDQRTRAFQEEGGFAALRGQANNDQVTTTSLGLRAQQDFELAGREWSVNGMLGWRHAFGDVNPQSVMAFDGGSAFTVAGTAIARDAAMVGVGLRTSLSRTSSVGVSYNGEFGGGNRENAAVLNVRWQF